MEVGSDYQRAAELNSERVELEPLVTQSARVPPGAAVSWMKPARCRDAEDEDMRLLAEAEIAELQPASESLGAADQEHAAAQGPARRAQRDHGNPRRHRRR